MREEEGWTWPQRIQMISRVQRVQHPFPHPEMKQGPVHGAGECTIRAVVCIGDSSLVPERWSLRDLNLATVCRVPV